MLASRILGIAVVIAALAALAARAAPAGAAPHPWRDFRLDVPTHTRAWTIRYRAHTGGTRLAYVLLPRWYRPGNDPPIPLIISPHGRGTNGRTNAKLWGDLPGLGAFAVVNPDGAGNVLGAHSWGAPGQIDDLARMPAIVHAALPWLRIDPGRIYAIGGSMGGQETLLLVAKHPHLLAGAAAFDPLVDFAHQYHQFPRLQCNAICRGRLGAPLGTVLQRLARAEVGGDPATAASAYRVRSPLTYARALATSCVPLQIWWSTRDRIVVDPSLQSGRLYATLRRLNPTAPVEAVEGSWAHSAEMEASTRLPFALAQFRLLPPTFNGNWGVDGTHYTPAPDLACAHSA